MDFIQIRFGGLRLIDPGNKILIKDPETPQLESRTIGIRIYSYNEPFRPAGKYFMREIYRVPLLNRLI
jgi:hypothetical protein